MNVIFIVNEQAGGGKAAAMWSKYKQQLSIPYTEHNTEYAGHAIEIARSYKERSIAEKDSSYLVVAVGGDGTIHEVIEGVAGSEHIIVGAMKAGSGNDFARGYTVFSTIEQLELYVEQETLAYTTNDLGQLQWGFQKASFVNNTGVGFDAYVVQLVNRSKLKKLLNTIKLGKLAYLIFTVWALFTYKRFSARIYNEGKVLEFREVWFIAVCNQPYFGGGMKISPRSSTSDQKLELTVVHQLSRIKLLTVFLTVFWGKHERFKEVSLLQGSEFELELQADVAAHVDGESLGRIPAQQRITCCLDERRWKLADHSQRSRTS